MKYGQEGLDWRPKKANGAVGVGVWKEIWKESDWCWDNMTFRVGKGNMICFWTDVWCSESSLAQCFPHLFGMAAHQSLTVEEMWDQNSGQGNWNLHFLRDFNDWEIELVGEFLHILRGFKTFFGGRFSYMEKRRSGQFRVKEAYSLLTKSDVMGFPFKSIWVQECQLKLLFLRGSVMGEVVRALWDIVFGLVDVKWVFPGTVKEVLASWRGSFVGKKRKKIWDVIPLCIFWTAPINVPVSSDKFWLLTKDRAFSLPSPFDNKGNYIIRVPKLLGIHFFCFLGLIMKVLSYFISVEVKWASFMDLGLEKVELGIGGSFVVDQLPSTYLEMKLGASFESGDGILGGTEDVDRAAVLFGCKVRKLPTTYLESESQIGENSKGVFVRRFGGEEEYPLEEEFLEESHCWKIWGGGGDWTTSEVKDSYGLGLWIDIRKGWEEFFLRTIVRIGNGRHTSFWWDIWVGDSKLKDVFPTLFRIAAHKFATMADYGEAKGWRWLLGGAF
ncbi:Electron transfer flavoprotein-ubiquinone oxidoreductase, mitochondrial [Vitis vinifera]|uniref:Electron transfer flavoprotein-ubiquinone oxidoreductase, mitochondrial n=1 Tax=Vitis vinifera TaxID=29760 RepID=A0A438HVW7_VITVI|nr:Electron transfer flavoprotein-ubiquinone oxidoreductase, mitochondrial [Vitis vinifera]